jgi:hypothetical protein
MKLPYTPLIIFSLFIALAALSVSAQSGIGQGEAPVPQSNNSRPWGVKVTDPAIDAMRNQMIQQVGVDAVVTARFSAAINRLTILDARIVSLLNNIPSTCTFKSAATKELSAARTVLSSVDTQAIISVPDMQSESNKNTASNSRDSISIIDPAAATELQATLETSLSGMKSAVGMASRCPTITPSGATASPTSR